MQNNIKAAKQIASLCAIFLIVGAVAAGYKLCENQDKIHAILKHHQETGRGAILMQANVKAAKQIANLMQQAFFRTQVAQYEQVFRYANSNYIKYKEYEAYINELWC